MKVRFWGTRGSIAVPGEKTSKYGGNTSCVEVRAADGTVIVLDCGTGARELGRHLLASTSKPLRLHLFIGHTHWDHIQGFPFFGPVLLPETEMNVYAPAGFQRSVEDAIAGQMQYSYFPITLRDLRSRIHFTELEEGFFRVGEVLIQTQYLNHTAPTLAYRISSGGATVAYVTDHEPFWKPAGRAFRHPGDQRHLSFLEGSDLIIHDAQYSDEEYAGKIGWGHSTVEYATDIALSAGSSRLALFHHDPVHDDVTVAHLEATARERAAATSRSLEVFAAAEGLELDVRGNGHKAPVTAVPAIRRPPMAGKRVLVVSSNETEIATIGQMLTEDNLVLLPTSDKRTALASVAEVFPDMAIIDERLPDGTGADLIQPLRARLNNPDFPIIMLTEGTDMADSACVGGTASVDCLAKPFSPPMLRTRVLSWLIRATASESPRSAGTAGVGIARRSTDEHAADALVGGLQGAAAATYADTLALMPLFRSLDREQLLNLVAQATEKIFTAGNVVIHQGEPTDSLYVVLSGQMRVVQSTVESPVSGQVLAEVGYGEIFGEMGVLTEQPRSATVVAVEHTRCLALAPDDFMKVLQRTPEMAIAVLRMLARRLYHADRLLARYAPDPLTGLLGRRAFHDHYQRLAAGSRRRRSGVVLMVLDIIHLKTINDRFGYMVGDEVLRTVADALTEATRTTDLVARYGGDEFAVLLVDTGPAHTAVIVKRVHERLSDLAARRGLPLAVQCAIGMAGSHEPPETADELLWVADEDLRRR
ncbi:MAG: diguanylate cyclase [Nitrospirae bacterium]|nr:MAG: diguanylate cyclase [Nitrospirota bacterium]